MAWLLVYALAFFSAVAGALFAATLVLSRRLESLNPPDGEFVQAGGVRLHLVDIGGEALDGRAPALVLLHGANLDHRDMQTALGARLAPRFRTLFFDRPGQGHSAIGRIDTLAPDAQVELLHAALTTKGVDRAIVVAHSLGGLTALRYALRYPDAVAGLVLVNPTSHPRETDLLPRQKIAGRLLGPLMVWTFATPFSGPLCAMFARRLFQPQTAPEAYAARSGLTLGMTPRRLLASLAEYEGLRAELARTEPLYSQIAAPAVVLAGGADTIVPPELHARRLALALPDARLVELSGAGHMLHHAHADLVIDAIDSLRNRRPG